MVPSTLLLALVLVVLGGAASAEDVVCTTDFEWILSEDCRTLHRCDWGVPKKMPDCAEGLIYSREHFVCVREGGRFRPHRASLSKPPARPCYAAAEKFFFPKRFLQVNPSH